MRLIPGLLEPGEVVAGRAIMRLIPGLMKNPKKEVHKLKKLIKRSEKKRHLNIFFRYHYKKLTVLGLSIILSYLIFSRPEVSLYLTGLEKWEYLSIFIAGMLLAPGFSAPLAAGFLIAYNPSSIIISALIATFGSLIIDIAIFRFIRFTLLDEFKRLKRTSFIKEVHNKMNSQSLNKFKVYIMYSFIGLMIASPLPDEIGITMLAGLTKIKQSFLAILIFALHFVGALVLLSI